MTYAQISSILIKKLSVAAYVATPGEKAKKSDSLGLVRQAALNKWLASSSVKNPFINNKNN